MASCQTCKKGPPEVPLKQCAKCNVTTYCSRDCQKADWKTHKKICGKQDNAEHSQPSASSASRPSASSRQSAPFNVHTVTPGARSGGSPPKGTDKPVDKPFVRLAQNTWLHDRSEKDVYRLLIDAYRMRAEDLYNMQGDVDEDSVYDGSPDSSEAFIRFLDDAEEAGKGILPSWWNAEKRAECLAMGMRGTEWQNLRRLVEKSDIQEHYGEPQFPMQLRMFSESIYGVAPGGFRGGGMMAMMAGLEMS